MRRYILCCVFWRCQHFLKLDFCVCPIRVKNGCVNKCSAHSLVCFSPPFWWLIEWNAIKFTFAAKLPSKLFARPPFKCWLALAIINANKSSHLTHKTPIGELLPVPLGSPFFFFLASAQFQLLLKCQCRWGMCKNNYGNPLDDRCKGGKYRCVCEWEAGMGTRKHLNVLKPIFAIQLKCCICQSTLD